MALDIEPFGLRVVAQSSVSVLALLAREKGLALTFVFKGSRPGDTSSRPSPADDHKISMQSPYE
jgi:hypothetical protein